MKLNKIFYLIVIGFFIVLNLNTSKEVEAGDIMVQGAARMGYELITTKQEMEKRYGITIRFVDFDEDGADHIYAMMDQLQNFGAALTKLQALVNNGLSEIKLKFKQLVIQSTWTTIAVESNEDTVFIYVDRDYVGVGGIPLTKYFIYQNRSFDLVDTDTIINRLYRDLELIEIRTLKERAPEEVAFEKNKAVRMSALKKRLQEIEAVKFDTRFNYPERLKILTEAYEKSLETLSVIPISIPAFEQERKAEAERKAKEKEEKEKAEAEKAQLKVETEPVKKEEPEKKEEPVQKPKEK